MQRSTIWILIFVLGLGAFFRFYKLDWGEGMYAHPDEYHIVASVSQLSFPSQMHPHFFSYGTATIYAIYFTQEALKTIYSTFNSLPADRQGQLSPLNAFLIGRFYSALFSTLTILVVYKITESLLSKKWAILAAFLVALTPGLIQQAHFATPESALTFFLFGSLLFVLRYDKFSYIRDLFISAVLTGIALGVKIIALLILPVIAVAFLIKQWRSPPKLIVLGGATGLLVLGIFTIVAPYVFLDYPAWRSTTLYEGSLAMGKLPVFYTRQFIDTMPFFFQLTKILPFAIGYTMLLFGLLGFLGMLAAFIKKPEAKLLLFMLAFLSIFLPNALLFAKWTRFITPTFPFFAIFAVFFLAMLSKKAKTLSYALGAILIVTTFLWSLAFFSIYTRHDVRVEASSWLELQSPVGTSFLVEGGNMVDLPLKGDYKKTSLDFYNLETDPQVRSKIADALVSSDYFLIQSRRVFMNHQRLPHLYPKTASFYNALFTGRLGFVQVKEFHSYPSLGIGPPAGGLKLEIPDEGAEETWSVFDHPVIRVFKKNVALRKEDYAKIFED